MLVQFHVELKLIILLWNEETLHAILKVDLSGEMLAIYSTEILMNVESCSIILVYFDLAYHSGSGQELSITGEVHRVCRISSFAHENAKLLCSLIKFVYNKICQFGIGNKLVVVRNITSFEGGSKSRNRLFHFIVVC